MHKTNKYLEKILTFFMLIAIFSCNKEKSTNDNYGKLNENSSKETLLDSTNSFNNKDSLISKRDSVIDHKQPIDSTKLYVYLTFDDGPFKGSKNISNVLTQENIKGTAFLVGINAYTKALRQNVEEYKLNPNVEIANHTYSHAKNKYKKFYSSPESVFEDILKNEKDLDIHTKWVRLPARNVWRLNNRRKGDVLKDANVAADIIANHGYYIFGWDYEWERNPQSLENPQKIYNGMINLLDKKRTFTKNHLVILMHDDMFNSDVNTQKLIELINLLKSNPKIRIEGNFELPYLNKLFSLIKLFIFWYTMILLKHI